ncbi:hypothetical protein HGRIS_013555 [Hohenbuehelia grisea]|uniref:Uncharacterized protein n=1 Tax=Hohenbuehelia grisea TaxID=104357 RepID=A0ABR3IVZ9_9AGAR
MDPPPGHRHCTCPTRCKGGKWIPERTWRNHAKYRCNNNEFLPSVTAFLQQQAAVRLGNPVNPASSSSGAQQAKRKRNTDDEAEADGEAPGPEENDWEDWNMHSPSGFEGPLHGGSRSGSPSSQPGAPSPPGSRPDSPIQPPPPPPADPGSESDNEDDLGPGDHRPDAEEQLPFSRIEDVKLSQEFIELLKSANLDDSGLGPDDLEDLRKPSAIPLEVLQNPDFRLSIRLFLSSLKSSEATYTENVAAIKERFPECTGILSLDQVKRRLKQLTGVVPVMHDMCVNTCIAFTGPFSELDTCNHCSQPRGEYESHSHSAVHTVNLALTLTMRPSHSLSANSQSLLTSSQSVSAHSHSRRRGLQQILAVNLINETNYV